MYEVGGRELNRGLKLGYVRVVTLCVPFEILLEKSCKNLYLITNIVLSSAENRNGKIVLEHETTINQKAITISPSFVDRVRKK